MLNKGNIIPRDAIIDELWQSEEFIDENTLNVNVVRLRKSWLKLVCLIILKQNVVWGIAYEIDRLYFRPYCFHRMLCYCGRSVVRAVMVD